MASPEVGSRSLLNIACLGLGRDFQPVIFSSACNVHVIVRMASQDHLTSRVCGPVALITATPGELIN